MSKLGIDYGTSNTAASVNIDGVSQIVKFGEYNYIPSVLYFPLQSKNVLLGHDAIKAYVENLGEGRLLQSVKSLMKDSTFISTQIRNHSRHTPEMLVAHTLRHVKEVAEIQFECDFDEVVLGRPAQWSTDPTIESLANRRLVTAAQMAGFRNIKLELEPVAAGYHLESLKQNKKIVLVADFGAGTSDFTLMNLSAMQSSRESIVIGSTGIYKSGNDLDAAILSNRIFQYFGKGGVYTSYEGKELDIPAGMFHELARWQNIPLLNNHKFLKELDFFIARSDVSKKIERMKYLIEQGLGFALFQEIERVKKSLSKSESQQLVFSDGDLTISELITQKDFNTMISRILGEMETSVKHLLEITGMIPNDIDSIFLTGGTSLVPSVRKIFINIFGEEKVMEQESFTSVAKGLSLVKGFDP